MEVYPFHHKNTLFNIITDYDLTFKEIREMLDYLLEMDAFSEKSDEFEGGKFHDIRLGKILYEVDVQGYEIVIYRRTEVEE